MPDDLSVTPTVAKDVAADAAGEARDVTPSPPPPGTIVTTFLQSSATKAAIVATVFFGFIFADGAITGTHPSTDAIVLGYKAVAVAWLTALGLYGATDSLRYK